MRRALVFILILPALSCSLFRAKTVPYPIGLMFPLEEAARVEFEGKIVGGWLKSEAGRVYFSTDKGILYCLDSVAQEISWTFVGPSSFGSSPALGVDRLFAWDQENSVFCLDKKGALLWQVRVSEKISSPISLDRNHVYFGTETGRLLTLSQASGELLWSFDTAGAVAAGAVFFDNRLCLGSGDGWVYVLSATGRLRGAIEIGSPILVTPLVDGHRLYVGSEDRAIHCYDLRNMKRRWMITAGGRLLATPRADQEKIYFPASNGVVYALNKENGHIIWWWISPSRSRYSLEFDGQNILTTSASPNLHSLNIKSGSSLGQFKAGEEIRSNPAWVEPHLLIALFDPQVNKGRIVFLRKKVGVKLSAAPASPQPQGTEVTFTATATGFHLPQFEFSMIRGEERTVVQTASERATWVWYADKEGPCRIRVRVVDERQSQEAEIDYEIAKKDQPNVDGKRSAGR